MRFFATFAVAFAALAVAAPVKRADNVFSAVSTELSSLNLTVDSTVGELLGALGIKSNSGVDSLISGLVGDVESVVGDVENVVFGVLNTLDLGFVVTTVEDLEKAVGVVATGT
jgi:hypothetical protein